ncbi:MAG: hypothetical protein RLZZ156_1582 [Deinococcota bacterium]|jgi:hypothetical protein
MQLIPDQYQYLIDPNGTKTHIMLPLEEYEELIDRLLDARDALELPALRELDTERVTIEQLREEFGLDS